MSGVLVGGNGSSPAAEANGGLEAVGAEEWPPRWVGSNYAEAKLESKRFLS